MYVYYDALLFKIKIFEFAWSIFLYWTKQHVDKNKLYLISPYVLFYKFLSTCTRHLKITSKDQPLDFQSFLQFGRFSSKVQP